jgi:DMSO/TMAO reductase YedYZ molybdopterin-dependent catalytic subunit
MQRRRDDGVGLDELAQATRNHGMPLEALACDLTPAGLHYLLIHYDVPFVDEATWRLTLEGFDRPLVLGLDDLRSRPSVRRPVTLECAGNGRAMSDVRPFSQPWLLEAVGTASWGGTPLAPILEEAGVPDGTIDLAFRGLDHGIEGGEHRSYERGLPLAEAMRPEVMIAYEMNGQPLLPQHGAPARLVVPGWYGMAHVKWLGAIEALAEGFRGYQNDVAYRVRADDFDVGEPLTRIRVRSLIEPPGVPSFPERERSLDAGPATIRGRAWSGSAPVEHVDVSTDGGTTWAAATVEPAPAEHAWHRWHLDWTATPGVHELVSRATDATGDTQPMRAEPNLGGYANNAVHRVTVTVA